jgi:pilus assembly protein FimV
MMALQRRNPQAFLDKNVNRLKSGAILEVPDSTEVERMGSAAAKTEFQRQTQAWQEKRALTSQLAAQAVPQQGVAAETPEQQAPPVPGLEIQEPADEQAQLRILEPVDREAVELALNSTEGGVGQQMQRLRTAIEASERELESVREINRELDKLRATLETEIGALRQAVQERDAVIDELVKRMEQEDAAAAALQQSESASGALIAPPVEEEEPGAIDSSLAGSGTQVQEAAVEEESSGWVTGLLAVVILVMSLVALYLWWSLNRGRSGKEESVLFQRVELPEVDIKQESYDGLYRKLEQQELEERMQQETGQEAQDQVEGEEAEVLLTDEFLGGFDEEPSDVEETPEFTTEAKVDVGAILTEADVYLIYRQYAKAESLVQECLQSHPQEIDLMAKLLEIYASQKAKAQYVAYLEEVADLLQKADPGVWRRVEDVGSTLVPEHPLFNLGGSAVSEDEELDSGLSLQDPEVTNIDIPSIEERLQDNDGTGALDSVDLELDLDDSDKG